MAVLIEALHLTFQPSGSVAMMSPLLWLWSAAFKAQHFEKDGPNADMSLNNSFCAGVLDGVGGVVEFGLCPEDLPYELRQVLKDNLRMRFNPLGGSASESRYDTDALRTLGLAPSGTQRKGEWLRNLVAVSLQQHRSCKWHGFGLFSLSFYQAMVPLLL